MTVTNNLSQEEMFHVSCETIRDEMRRRNIPHPWPSGDVVDWAMISQPYKIFQLMSRVDWKAPRQRTMYSEMPFSIRQFMSATQLAGARDWRFARPMMRGQILRHPDPNVVMVFEPRHNDDIYWVEIGCKHDFKNVVKSDCYYESRCSQCNYWWGVDSSD